MKIAIAGLALVLAAGAAMAGGAPQPRRAVHPEFFTGRWYEILRTRNDRQRECEAPTYTFEPKARPDQAGFTLACRRGSPSGKVESLQVTIRVPQDASRNKFRATALAGLLSQEYWVLDIADDRTWAILATPGGNYVWLLARRPQIEAPLKERLLEQIGTMGYDLRKIEHPRH